ncbi:hypothetical protein BS47DRAFT_1342889 [Hydnum rufescens UP504]|uniref:Uncharacterized protein n=1 Tax=Hydnum rufescens UP504 TaxID=1448309 RepID=A0A9P6AYY0_9AGAM|nr:hypothetical protein BS47DRAFT_1342889 [Hydnum rufescens UP504]
MGIRNMEWDEWLQLDNRFPAYHAIKVHRMATQGDKMVRTLPTSIGIPSGTLAAKELVHEMAEYLSRRFPQVYSVVRKPHVSDDFGWYGEGEIHTITITPLGVTYDLSVEDPMSVAGLLVQDDLALMLEGSDGRYYFQAGSICLPGFWKLADKIGLPLEEIHIRGKVPQYEQKLMHSIARFFTKIRVSKPVTRNNYFIQVVNPARADSIDPDELGWSDTTNGPEDAFDQATKQPTLAAQASGQINFQPPQPSHDVRDVRFRTERQSLRRLPRSGAIVFTVRTYIDPIVELAKEPGVPGRLASGIRSWPEDVAAYKGLTLYRDVALPYLDECHARQVAEGICVDGQSQMNYPF